MDVRGKLDDSRLNSDRIIGLFGRPNPLYALLYSIQLHFAADRKQLVVISGGFVGPIIHDKSVKFRDNATRSRRRRHFGPFFFNFENCQPGVARDVISGVAV